MLAAAFAGAFRFWGLPRVAALVTIGFDCFLRSGELLGLRRRDIRVYEKRGVAIVALHGTKTGQRDGRTELAAVRSAVAVKLLAAHAQPLGWDEPVLGIERTVFLRLWKRIAGAHGLSSSKCTLYSLRRGGATHDFLEHGSLEKTLLRGRWASARSARMYIYIYMSKMLLPRSPLSS